MKKYLLLAAMLTACSPNTEKVTIKGQAGLDGSTGQDGYSTVSSSYSSSDLCGTNRGGTELLLALDLDRSNDFTTGDLVQTQVITCNGVNGVDGLNGTDGVDGVNGQDGQDGQDGTNGADGVSCSVTKTASTATITCGASQVAVTDGTSPVMPSGVLISNILNPCGVENGGFDEVILKLSNGKFLAVYDGGPNEDHLHIMVENTTYTTTDRNGNQECKLVVQSGELKSCLQNKNPNQQCTPVTSNTVGM